jgi:cation diffusion facilitator family transporter
VQSIGRRGTIRAEIQLRIETGVVMAAGGSVRVIIFAFTANLGIAICKLVVAIITGSGAMMAESIHSFADSGNQLLLLVGERRAKKLPDDRYPLGYGREAYFWALLVAVILFSLGGLYSLYEGVHKVRHPVTLNQPGWALGVLVVGMLLEGASLRAAWMAMKRKRGAGRLIAWARTTGDVNLLVVVFEDLAAMLGLGLAFVAVGLTALTGNPVYDALGTCVIGVLLLLVAVFLASQVRRLIVGFTAGPEIRDGMARRWEAAGFEVVQLAAIWSGPGRMLVVGKVRPKDPDAPNLIERLDEVDREIYQAFPEVQFHFVEPDLDADDESAVR